jgi:SynChlorMet cassette protein ScmC
MLSKQVILKVLGKGLGNTSYKKGFPDILSLNANSYQSCFESALPMIYSLIFPGNLAIALSAAPEMTDWLREFSRIVMLHETNQQDYQARIHFVKTSFFQCWQKTVSSCSGIDSNYLPKEGWRTDRFGRVQLWFHPLTTDVCCEIDPALDRDLIFLSMNQALSAVYHLVRRFNGMPVHAALVAWKGKGVLLMGSSGAGKTTCCTRLPEWWTALSDDQALVLPVSSGGFEAHPLPTWSDLMLRNLDKRWDISRSVPLCAVAGLLQGDADEIVPLNRSRGAVALAQSAAYVSLQGFSGSQARIAEIRNDLLNAAIGLAKTIPFYRLSCTVEGNFWSGIEHALENSIHFG